MHFLVYCVGIILIFPICSSTSLQSIQYVNRPPLEVNIRNSITRFNPLADIVRHSERLALRNCQEVFKWDQWNCPTEDFFLKKSSNSLDREGAFVKAITVAAVIYTSIKNCSANFMECDCNFNNPASDENHLIKCVDYIALLENLLIRSENSINFDIQGYAEVHNARAGRIAIQQALKHQCRCSGYSSSNSCSLQTCWILIEHFSDIAGNIRKMYDHGIKVSFDNTGRVKRNIKSESLVYLENSPNYCRENVTEGWPGMRGRQCSRRKKDASSLQERRSCRKLCRACGLKVKKKQGIKQNLCKCKFFWCCDVQCETCPEVINEYFCY